ncbi:MAG TPA: NAD-dependent DNA ligase LigA [Candidatus Paceibacterota bacterium]|nr:NAD-dependent DNA ligase LigA [Candidatus Paceibacterota bacterium]HPT40116.1 NAD-dependent DNA ligase LigA [Candidatus Paceibacterota bacterium]
MDRKEAQERIEKLKKEINYHRYLYHVLDKPDLSDAIFDSLKNELEELEYKFPDLITPDSPTQRVGGEPLKEFKKVNHLTPMVSFNDAFSEQEMREWEKRYSDFLNNELEKTDFQYYCELKIDGLAIELEYENGVFKTGSTRGDGKIGEDVTQNLKTIQAIPLRLLEKDHIIKNLKNSGLMAMAEKLEKNFPKTIIVRGEVFLNKKDFERLNQEQEKTGGKAYANPRNVAAGSIRQLNPKITAARNLDFFAYSLITDFGQVVHEQEHIILKSLGFRINPHNEPAKDMAGIFNFHQKTQKIREKLAYEIDGIVVILNSESDFKKAGIRGKAPRAAIAYKFSAREATTKILDIQIQIGRTGALTPVAIMEPVGIGGITVSRATLHNYDEIQRLGVKIGDTVSVSRAGDVIPQVNEVFKNLRTGKEKEFRMPNQCPMCDSPIKKDEGGVIYRCLNKNCFARSKENLYHFVSKPAFDIKGVGPKIIDRLLEENLIHDASDLFILKEGDLSVLERFGEKSATNIIKSINNKKSIELHRFIYSLGIIHVGEETAIALEKFISFKKIINKPTELLSIMEKISIEELQEIPDIGPKVAESIYHWFQGEKNKKFINELEDNGVLFKVVEKGSNNKKLANLTFVLTGSLETMSRDEAKEKIRDLGGKISSDVSKETDYVIAGSEPGSKYDKAQGLKIKIINEEEFIKMIK